MQNFTYYVPTKVVFGKDTEQQVGALVKEHGGKKALVHYGSKSAEESGLIDRVIASLEKEGIGYVKLGGVVPNPRLSKVYEGIALCKKEGVDFLLAVGGGSAIDSAKAISYGLANPCDVWEVYENTYTPTAFMPVGSVVTIAAAGSETSNSSVITKEEGLIKRGRNDEISRPVFAVMNPELTCSLPQYQTMSGCVDILMHTIERYFTSDKDSMDITDRMAEGLLRTVMENALILMKEPKNYKARAEILWAGSLSHSNLMHCGATRGDWACHRMEHELGGMFDVAHGAGISAIWGSWARYVYKGNEARFAEFARNVMGVQNDDDEAAAIEGIEALEAFFRSIEMPVNLEELMGRRVTDEELVTLAKKSAAAAQGGTLGDIRVLHEQDMYNIFKMAQ